MAWRVDQVDFVAFVFDTGRSAGDRDPAFTFQFHMVHRGPVTVATDFFNFVDSTGVEQDSLAERCFARIDMGTDPDVSDFLQTHNFSFA